MIDRQRNIVMMLFRMIPSSGKIHQNQEVYSVGGVSPTIKATAYKNPPKILIKRIYNNAKNHINREHDA